MIVKEINTKSIVAGENIRQVVKDEQMTSLMQTIKDNGLLQPIGVKELSNGTHKIMWGNRRFAACKKLGWKTVPAVIYSSADEEMTEEEFIVVNGIENLQQSPNTLFEIGRICKILRKTMSVSEIAVRLGISKSRVDTALSEIARVPVKWQRKIKMMDNGTEENKGWIPVTTAVKVVHMRGLSKDSKDKMFEHMSKNDHSSMDIELIGSIVQSGKNIKDALKIANKYESSSFNLYFNKKELEKALKGYDSKIDLVIAAVNKVYPKLVIKNLR